MARLRLQTRTEYTIACTYRGTTPPQTVLVPGYKPYVRLHSVTPGTERGWRPPKVLDEARTFDAVVDTGASITNLPHGVWSAFESEIRWLAQAGPETVGLGGAEYPFRLGRVLLAALDWQGRWMPPAWTVARLLEPTAESVPPLLGLLSPFLTLGRLVRHEDDTADHPGYWLEDA